jgi:hypothetical protein
VASGVRTPKPTELHTRPLPARTSLCRTPALRSRGFLNRESQVRFLPGARGEIVEFCRPLRFLHPVASRRLRIEPSNRTASSRDSCGLQSGLDEHHLRGEGSSSGRSAFDRSTRHPRARRGCGPASRWPAVIGTTPSVEHRDRPALGRPPRRRGALDAPALEADRQDAGTERLRRWR